jgi:hypothetical protein
MFNEKGVIMNKEDMDLTSPLEGYMSLEQQKKMALELAYDELHSLRFNELHAMLRDFLMQKYRSLSPIELTDMYEKRFWYMIGE